MAIRLLVGALLSGVVLMVWGFVFWMFAPWPKELLRELPPQNTVIEALESAKLQTGVYVYPKPPAAGAGGAAQDDFKRLHKMGPILQIFYHKEGKEEAMTSRTYIQGYAQVALASLLAGTVLCCAGARSYFARVFQTLLMGLFAVLLVQIGAPIWFDHPWDYHLMFVGFHMGNALLIGLVMGAFVKPRACDSDAMP